ncbi:MAG: heavy metal-responsive transcriptional regulator [Acidobacteriota bacterium]
MQIGKVAEQAGVNTQTIRFYERSGLLNKPPRTQAGYRSYSPATVEVVRFIKQSQELGYTLAEVKQLISLHEHGSNGNEIRDLAAKKLRDIAERIDALVGMRQQLRSFLTSCNCGTPEQPGCPPIEKLDFSVPCHPVKLDRRK